MKIKVLSLSLLSLFSLLILCQQQAIAQNWLTSGNALAGGEKLGSTNAQPVNIVTNNTNRIFIGADGKVGINTTSPVNLLTVRSSGGSFAPAWAGGGNPVFVGGGEEAVGNTNFELRMASSLSNGRSIIKLLRARGTIAAPAAVQTNDHIGSISATSYDGSAFQVGAAINFYSDGTPSSGNSPTSIAFLAGSNSSSPERLRISSNGNFSFNGSQLSIFQSSGDVGLGTGKLFFSNSSQSILFPAVSSTTNNPMIYMFGSGTQNKDRMVIGHSPSFPTWGLQYQDSLDKFNFLGAGSPALTADLANLRVGVGTSSPASRLDVLGNAALTTPVVNVIGTFLGNTDVRGIFSNSKAADGWGYGIEAIGGYRGGSFTGDGGAYTGTTYGVLGSASGTAGTRIGVYGSAGGGTDNWGGYFPTKTYASEIRVGGTTGATGYVAAINGKLIATEVRVEAIANWPDYVFDKGYKLPTLDELEAKIKAEKHLPGVPAANEMKDNGIMLGEMQTKTMEKVEELTLYILQLNNKIKELEKKIDELTNKGK